MSIVIEKEFKKTSASTDLVGKVFSRLTVLSFSHYEKSKVNSRSFWICKCECGNSVTVRRDNLTRGRTRSCGCLEQEINSNSKRRYTHVHNSALKILYGKYKHNARIRDREFSITLNDFERITSQPCYYCGILPFADAKYERVYDHYLYNGLDRVNNSLGYTVDNCVSCCQFCNVSKHDRSLDDFIFWIDMTYHNLLFTGLLGG